MARWKRYKSEVPKDHSAIPDGLGIGIHEERDNFGRLIIYAAVYPPAAYVVFGKYADPRKDGSVYYVANYLNTHPWSNSTEYFDDLLMAVSYIHDTIAKWKERNKQ